LEKWKVILPHGKQNRQVKFLIGTHLPVRLMVRILDGNFFRSGGQLIASLAQALLEINQCFAAKSINAEESSFALFKASHDLTHRVDSALYQSIDNAIAQAKVSERAIWRCARVFANLLLIHETLAGLQFAIEAIHLAFAVHETLLLTGEEWMALRANFGLDYFLG
jgi:hypothetical protein